MAKLPPKVVLALSWALALMLAWLLLNLAAVAWIARVLARTWSRRRELKLLTKLFASLVAAVVSYAVGGTLWGLIMAFRAVGGERVDPSEKARFLAEGISEAMNCTAFGLVVGMPSLIALVFILRKLPPRDAS